MVSDDTGTGGGVTTLDGAGVDAVALGTSVVAGGTVYELDGGASGCDCDGELLVDGWSVEESDGCPGVASWGVEGAGVEPDDEGVGEELDDGVGVTLGAGQSALAEGVPAIGIRPPESMESAGSLEMPHGSTAGWSEVLGGAVFVPKPVMGASATLPLPNVIGFADGFPVRYGMGSVNPPLTMILKCR